MNAARARQYGKISARTTEGYDVSASLDGPGIRFHGVKRHDVPPHVWQAIRDAALAVLDNYTRIGTPCGHQPSPADENRCAVMICRYSTRDHSPGSEGHEAHIPPCWCGRRTCRGCVPITTDVTT